jgi:hypothetical protein
MWSCRSRKLRTAAKRRRRDMTAESETAFYYVRGTDPRNDAQVAYECVGFAMAHAKAAELRMGGYKDVILSIASVNDNETGDGSSA